LVAAASTGKVASGDTVGPKGNAADAGSVFNQQRNFWSKDPIQFNGNKVYQRDDLIKPDFVDARGRTNLERMQKGLAPIGPDGKSMNLHHTTQTQKGPIAEMTETFHKDNHKVIHINPPSIPSGIDRLEFDRWRSAYWKARAKDFM
jgi:filamentous hemagglutinin